MKLLIFLSLIGVVLSAPPGVDDGGTDAPTEPSSIESGEVATEPSSIESGEVTESDDCGCGCGAKIINSVNIHILSTCGGLTCHQNAHCQALSGGCVCNAGYEGDGVSNCEKIIGPCDSGTHDCDLVATCTNLIGGGYNCECPPGYTGDGTSCTGNFVIPGLGIVMPVGIPMPWAGAHHFCQERGAHLLEGLNSTIVELISQAFPNFGPAWIGVKEKHWFSDNSIIPKGLWVNKFKTRGCGIMSWSSSLTDCDIAPTRRHQRHISNWSSGFICGINCSGKRHAFCVM